jgi:hypothetical protein
MQPVLDENIHKYLIRCLNISHYYYYYYIVVVDVVVVSCHRHILTCISAEQMMIPTAPDSSFRLQYFPYCVSCS